MPRNFVTEGDWWTVPERPNITRYARQLWRFTYGERWPKGWRVAWIVEKGFPTSQYFAGVCIYEKKLILIEYMAGLRDSIADAYILGQHWRSFFKTYPEYWHFGGVIETLLHEFTHMRYPGLRHGKGFNRRLDEAKRRLMRGCAPVVEAQAA